MHRECPGRSCQSWGTGLGKGRAERSFCMCTSTFSCLSRRESAEAPASWYHCVGQPTSRDRVPLCHQDHFSYSPFEGCGADYIRKSLHSKGNAEGLASLPVKDGPCVSLRARVRISRTTLSHPCMKVARAFQISPALYGFKGKDWQA